MTTNEVEKRRWFTPPQKTIEEAKSLYAYDLFTPAAVIQNPDGQYVLGYITSLDFPPHKTAQALKPHGYTVVAYTGPLVDIWHEYEWEANDDDK